VQTGVGRTGHWFAGQGEGVEPDLITLAKGLGGGLPLGACIAFGDAAGLLGPGQHATTFGGNPVCCAAGLAVLDTIAADGLLDRAKRLGERLRRGVEGIGSPHVSHVRGAGLLLGIVLTADVSAALAGALRAAGYLAQAVQPDVLRLAPPLILSDEQADGFLAAFADAVTALGSVPNSSGGEATR
jgi:acetylornithine aminotransferase